MKSRSTSSLTTGSQNHSFLQAAVGLINYDFYPSANSYVYCLKQPFGFVILAIVASLLAGLFIGPQGFVLMWAFVSLMVIGTVWPWLSLLKVKCSLSFTEKRTQENCETIARLEVVNRWPFPIYGMMIEGKFLQDVSDPDDLIATGMQKIPGWSVSKFTWHIKPRRRGCMPIETPEISTGFPFGILKNSRKISVSNQTIVWPESITLEGGIATVNSSQSNGNALLDRCGFDGETIGVRDFREGDSIRFVHWAKTAQVNRLVTKELQSSVQRTVRIVLDLTAETHLGTGSQDSYEMAIRVAGTLARKLHAKQINVNLQCIGVADEGSSRVSTEGGMEVFFDFLAMLPSIEELPAIAPNSDYSKALELAGQKGETVILICSPKSQFKTLEVAVAQTFLVKGSHVVNEADRESDSDVESNGQFQIRFDPVSTQTKRSDQPAGRRVVPNFANI